MQFLQKPFSIKFIKEKENFLSSIALSNLNSKGFYICGSEIKEKYQTSLPRSMPKGKFPEHDSLTKIFYELFWNDLKFHFVNSLKQSKINL